MPFKSTKQRRWMWANKPKIARRWVKKYGKKNADYLMEVMGAWRQHYDRAAYIENQDMALPDYTDKVKELASKSDLRY